MPVFQYQAVKENGSEVRDEFFAADAEEARRDLAGKGLFVRQLSAKRAWRGLFPASFQKLKLDDFLQFTQEFCSLLQAGLALPEVVQLCSDRPDHPMLASALTGVLEELRSGSSFSKACARRPEVFDGLFVSSLSVGEQSGDLVAPLRKYQEFLRQRMGLQKKVTQAAIYPIFLLIVLAGVLALLFLFVMPRFVALYADFKAELPLPTRLLMALAARAAWLAPLCLAAAVLGWAALRRWGRSGPGRLWLDRARMGMPGLRRVVLPLETARLARALSTLLAGGTPLVAALETATQALPNREYARRLGGVAGEVVQGRSFARAVKETGLFPLSACRLLETGEASGSLEARLADIAAYHEQLVEERMARLMAVVEPAMILLTGSLVGGIIVVMYLPIFHLADILK